MSSYQPISCARYSELELHIMRGHWLRLRRVEGGDTTEERLLPVDIGTERGEEFLHVRREDGERLKIRLDAIVEFTPD